jgi:hypothetical protein
MYVITKNGFLQLRQLAAGTLPRRSGFSLSSGYVEFMVDKVTLERVFSEYYSFPCQIVISPTAPHSLSIPSCGTVYFQYWQRRQINNNKNNTTKIMSSYTNKSTTQLHRQDEEPTVYMTKTPARLRAANDTHSTHSARNAAQMNPNPKI